jgi:hypothetical protein
VFDMMAQSSVGKIPFGNIVLPILTWTAIGAFFQILAIITSKVRWPLWIPHVLNSIVALTASTLHGEDLYVAFGLVVVACITFIIGPNRGQRSSP